MSFQALGWAAGVKVTRASDKLVLLALADRHNTEHNLAYPSLAWICEFSSLDRKTVVAALDRLEEAGFIQDSGQRVGKTKQVKAYYLDWNGSEKGTVKTEPFEEKSAVIPAKQSQKRNSDTVLEPEQAKACYIKGICLPDWLPPEPWAAFVRMRKAKDKGFTEDAARGAVRKLDKHRGEGHDVAKLLWKSVDGGWKGFYPDTDTLAAKVTSAPTAADLEERARKWEQIGRADEAAECRRRAMSIGQLVKSAVNDTRNEARAS